MLLLLPPNLWRFTAAFNVLDSDVTIRCNQVDSGRHNSVWSTQSLSEARCYQYIII